MFFSFFFRHSCKNKFQFLNITQVDHSCHRISQDLAGKMRESHRILQENTGYIWNMEAVFPPGIFRIFSDDFRKVLLESTGSCWNSPGNSRPEYCFQLPSIFRCIPAVSRRTSFTWARMFTTTFKS